MRIVGFIAFLFLLWLIFAAAVDRDDCHIDKFGEHVCGEQQ